jgi:short-subunit dehydrogenase
LASELSTQCEIDVVEADLASPEGQAKVLDRLSRYGHVDLLVNNAGYSTLGPFATADMDAEMGMIHLHQEATMSLTQAVLPRMLDVGAGTVINVASMGAFVATPGIATYGATKAFLLSFSRSLHAEVSERGVNVQCLCPGYTRTEIHSRDSFAAFDVSRIPDDMWMDAEDVVRQSLEALESGTTVVVTGASSRALVRSALRDLLDSIPA